MARQQKTQRLMDAAVQAVTDFHPQTLRQVFYQLVSSQDVENTRSRYQAVGRVLSAARLEGIIPWEWIEDHLRWPRDSFTGFRTAEGYLELAVETLADPYYAAVWPTQPRYIETWLEKDALSSIFTATLAPYHMALNVGRGYDSWSAVHNAAVRFQRAQQHEATVLYFGDFDPSGEDMFHSLGERLATLGACPKLVKVALTLEDIERYHLPPNFTKVKDKRSPKHVETYGPKSSVELDALPPSVLRARLIEAVEVHMDMDALRAVQAQEAQNRVWLAGQVAAIQRFYETTDDE